MHSLLCEHEEIESVQFMPEGQLVVIYNSGEIGEKKSCRAQVFVVSQRGWSPIASGHNAEGSENPDEPDSMSYEHPMKEAIFSQVNEGFIETTPPEVVSRLVLLDEHARENIIEWVAPTAVAKPKKKAKLSQTDFGSVCVHFDSAKLFEEDFSGSDLIPKLWEFAGRLVGVDENQVIILD